MYFYLKLGKRVFTFGNDRKDGDRRSMESPESPVADEHREGNERRKNEPEECVESAEVKEEEGN